MANATMLEGKENKVKPPTRDIWARDTRPTPPRPKTEPAQQAPAYPPGAGKADPRAVASVVGHWADPGSTGSMGPSSTSRVNALPPTGPGCPPTAPNFQTYLPLIRNDAANSTQPTPSTSPGTSQPMPTTAPGTSQPPAQGSPQPGQNLSAVNNVASVAASMFDGNGVGGHMTSLFSSIIQPIKGIRDIEEGNTWQGVGNFISGGGSLVNAGLAMYNLANKATARIPGLSLLSAAPDVLNFAGDAYNGAPRSQLYRDGGQAIESTVLGGISCIPYGAGVAATIQGSELLANAMMGNDLNNPITLGSTFGKLGYIVEELGPMGTMEALFGP